jgi:hypothetical protein
MRHFATKAAALASVGIIALTGTSALAASAGDDVSSHSSRSSSSSSLPSVEQVEQMINTKTGLDIQWKTMKGSWTKPGKNYKRTLKLSGTGSMGQATKFSINCNVSYPPLSIKCTINFSL